MREFSQSMSNRKKMIPQRSRPLFCALGRLEQGSDGLSLVGEFITACPARVRLTPFVRFDPPRLHRTATEE